MAITIIRQLQIISVCVFSFVLTSCGDFKEVSLIKEAWNSSNDPKIFVINEKNGENRYRYMFSKLPLKSHLKITPWSDDYWATHLGGISYRWGYDSESTDGNIDRVGYKTVPFDKLDPASLKWLSPAEKLDIYMNDDKYPTVEGERYRTGVLKTVKGTGLYDPEYQIPTWYGLCHAWAAASFLYKEPKPVTLKTARNLQLEFGSSDVKALLAYFLDRSPSVYMPFIGMRCDISFTDLQGLTVAERKKKMNTAECRDLNAGTFHLLLANQIGILQKSFILDMKRDQEVWNHPVSGFSAKIVQKKNRASPGAARGTKSEVTIETELDYATESGAKWENGVAFLNTVQFKYRLELDKEGKIIGGAWLTDDRPDFAWTQTAPDFTSQFSAIKEIYEASVQEPVPRVALSRDRPF